MKTPLNFLSAGLFFLTIFLLGVWPAPADETLLRVSAAASLADALKEIGTAFTAETKVKVALNLGASSALSRQIEEGAPADVFFSADLAKMDALAARGLIQADTREEQLSNSLVVVVSRDSSLKINALKDLAGPAVRKVATGDPKTVPVGVYARAYLEKAGLWNDVSPKIVATDNVRSALAAVEAGNVEAGIVYKTDAAISRKVRIACGIPAMADFKIIYPMAVLKAAAQPQAAKQYLDFLDRPASHSTFEKFGFIVLPEAAAP